MLCFGRQCAVAAVALAIWALPGPVAAQPSSVTVQGTSLPLASCATRETLWLDLYRVALYLPEDVPLDARAILSPDTAKTVRLHVLYEGDVPDDIPEAWRERMRQETQRELRDVYSGLNTDDVVLLTHRPREGTTVMVNGRVTPTDAGARLVPDLLEALIGDDPTSQNMKRLLLTRGPC